MLVVEHRHGTPAGAKHLYHLLEKLVARILHLPLGCLWVVAMLAYDHHPIDSEFVAAESQSLGDRRIHLHGGKSRGSVAAEVVGADLVDVHRNQIHRRMMMRTVPSVAFEEPVDNMLAMRVFAVNRNHGG